MKNTFPSIFFVAMLLLTAAASSHATVTIEFSFENGTDLSGATGVLVADTGSNGFQSLNAPDSVGTILSEGENVGTSDDVIIAVMQANAGDPWTGGASGFADTLTALDYDALGISAGMPLILYVFPDILSEGDSILSGDSFLAYRNTVAAVAGGNSGFITPADPGVYTITALTAAQGGGFDPGNLLGTETYTSGNVGGVGGVESDDSRSGATALTSGVLVDGDLTAGDLDYYSITLGQISLLETELGTGIAPNVTIFDSAGREVAAGVLGAGLYHILIQGVDGTQNGAYQLTATASPLEDFRTDLTIGKSGGSQRGNGRYNGSGGGQKYNAISKRGRKVKIFFTVGNDGGLAGNIGLRATKSNKFYKLKYRRLTGGGINVSGAVTRGAGFVAEYAPLSRETFRLDAKPTRAGKDRRKTGRFTLRGTGGGVVDVVKSKVKIKK